ncbi:MAG: GspE/PulE family protein [Candidatus Rokuibacteriota bacterium]|nr:MAG: GspE/PulE family protein [Candidatus Rokubacteria bacterium]
MAGQESVLALQEKLANEQRLVQLIDRIHSAKTLDTIFIEVQGELLSSFDAERMTLYAIDHDKKEIYSKFLALDAVREIRVPISAKSVSGFVALSKQTVNIADAYDAAELKKISPELTFDSSWDKRTGIRTTQILCMPILHDGKVLGVMQILNKKRGPRFTKDDELSVARIAKTLGIAFNNQAQMGAQRRGGKFDYVVAQGLVTQDEVNQAVGIARQKNLDVETVLLEQFKVPKGELGQSLSQFYRVPFMEYDSRVVPPADLLKDLKLEFLKRNLWVPVRREGHTIIVLIDNPQDLQRVDAIYELLRGQQVQLAVGLRKDVAMFLAAAGGEAQSKDSIGNIITALGEESTLEKETDVSGSDIDENDSAVIRLANQIIIDAYKARASDIHVEPYGPQKDTMIRLRIDGHCREYQRIPGAYRRALAARLKIMAQLDIAERRKPQDGKIKFRLPDGRDIELRVATVPTQGGNEDVVMRILAASEPIPVDKLGMLDRNLREIKNAADKPYGLILCVGPTGSGKTTTLHSVLGYINKPERKIWTAEDPVEITQYGLRQVQVHPKIGFTFANAMRSFLRADPDVIMVGEMRDEETAATGIEASLTGHLVFSTLHTNSSVETVIRLLDMGLDPFNFADALLAVLAQRLVRRVCVDCKEDYHPEKDEFEELAHAFGEADFKKLAIKYDDDFILYRGKGCQACNNSGYRGRAAIHELLVASDPMKKLIQTKARVADMVKVAKEEGMTTLVQDGILKALDGLTDLKQVKAVAIK